MPRLSLSVLTTSPLKMNPKALDTVQETAEATGQTASVASKGRTPVSFLRISDPSVYRDSTRMQVNRIVPIDRSFTVRMRQLLGTLALGLIGVAPAIAGISVANASPLRLTESATAATASSSVVSPKTAHPTAAPLTTAPLTTAPLNTAPLTTTLPDSATEKPTAAVDPSLVMLLRHATAPGVGDPGVFQLRDCTTQRNLNEVGKEQSRQIGLAMIKLGFIPKQIWSSQWCRTMETARIIASTLPSPATLDAGRPGFSVAPARDALPKTMHRVKVTELDLLNSTFRDRGDARAQNEALRQFIKDLDPAAGPYLMISHQVNITDLANVYPASGHGVWLKLTGDAARPWIIFPADTDKLTLPTLEKQ